MFCIVVCRETKSLLNCDFSRQEERFNVLTNKERELLTKCQSKSKLLEEYESDNHKKCEDVIKTFSKMVRMYKYRTSVSGGASFKAIIMLYVKFSLWNIRMRGLLDIIVAVLTNRL